MANYSPLRYPGGKAKLYSMIKEIIYNNNLKGCTYVEPFAGGAGLALNLLFKGDVDKLILNDFDRSIYAFWYCCLYYTDEFIKLINETPVNLENWQEQRLYQKDKDNVDLLTLGFSTFYLNRTNRSGIIKGGIIGGQSQTGKYKLDCRFNKVNLIYRIREIQKYANKISIHNLDAVELINSYLKDMETNSFTFFDPPYYHKAQGLYTNFYNHNDHIDLKNKIIEAMRTHYIITYDNADEIVDIYSEMDSLCYDISYSATVKRKEKEIMIYSNLLKV
ncbi:MAG: DNA adenine methylase [Maledivibacter sp.]|jgi:DNA adenine methylase|nr:DNA adenine methylase [Maledivibacter sp.]